MNGRVLRSVTAVGAADYEFVRDSGQLGAWIESGRVIATDEVEPDLLDAVENEVRYVLEHPVVPFISYPYEWCFSALREAALLQLDLMLEGLSRDIALSDASPYNVQFIGVRPQLIDVLSLHRYRDGDYWLAHRQFCEQYLNPLLLSALVGVSFNVWLRGSLEGIPADALNRLLPWYRKLAWPVLIHATLPALFQSRAQSTPASAAVGAHATVAKGGLPGNGHGPETLGRTPVPAACRQPLEFLCR